MMRVTIPQRLAVAYVFLLFSRLAFSDGTLCSPVKGQLTSIDGTVEIGYGGNDWRPGKIDAPLCEDNSIRVGPNSRAAIALIGDVILRLDQNTTVRLVELTEEPKERSVIDLIIGALHSLSRSPRKLAVNTPFINGMIEGTEFLTRVDSDHADITVFEGKVIAVNDQGKLALTHGESAVARNGQAPQPKVMVRPRDAVLWALYYPPVIDFRSDEFLNLPDRQENVRRSIEFYQTGNFQKAFELISSLPRLISDPRLAAYRASLWLAVGRVDKANADIQNILQSHPDDGNALALQAIIKVVQNQQEQALEIASKAVKAFPDSTAGWLALSYAQQSIFNLEGARSSVEKVVQLEPTNALAWARLAELHSSFGELNKALEAAKKAEALNPELSRTQTVLGFAQLMRVNTVQAKESFNRAITFSPSDPLPKLGLGLAKIREGDLSEGRHDLEIAAGLDPNNAIIRSYLGKAYYEEKRAALTDREYETAKELDPNDPTPYFYDAIEKQTTNRPVEALHSLQKAIESNNNRAVYRSSLSLDGDLAARSASLGRIYSDLGFEKLALREGWKSVNTDPTNYSAHRLLADSYSAQPRHEIARVSELLQSQLLQPLNMTPIQPRLGESNLFLISAGGPGGVSFNEFNPLFNRDGWTFQTSGLAGENDTYSGEGILAGIFEHASYSIGYSHFQTDSWRVNADQQDDIANAFIQFELSPETSFQAEYRHRKTDYGDLTLRFFADDFFPGQRNIIESHTVRAGVRHNFTPTSILLGSFMFQNTQASQLDDQFPFPVPGLLLFGQEEAGRDSFSGEVQHLFRSEYLNLTSGIGYFNVNGQVDNLFHLGFPLFPIFVDSSGCNQIIDGTQCNIKASTNEITRHLNVYSYGQIKLMKRLTAILGLSYEDVSGDFTGENVSQFNPKFGIILEPFKGTTLRAAAFRTLKRTLVTNQTLEPTQVAGFNQFFDDINRTEAWNYGGAIDQKFTQNVYGGVEFTHRDMQVPSRIVTNTGTIGIQSGWLENNGRVYLFWTPHDWVALRAEYQYEWLKHDEDFPEGVIESNTHRVPLGVSFFYPSGLSSSLTANYIHQYGTYGGTLGVFPIRSASDSFWTIDAAVSYRLPKRYGFITFGGRNLFDNRFNFFDSDLNNPSLQPGRMLFGRLTLQFP